ncbi:hypothetical protein D3C73_622960 [compost metagenome]
MLPPCTCTQRITASTAPLRTLRPSDRSIPLIRVSALNSMNSAPFASASSKGSSSFFISSSTDLPSGVSSFTELIAAHWATDGVLSPAVGTNSLAIRFPKVIVPVLSNIIVLISPAASTAFPDIASTLNRVTRSIPAIPIADNNPPIVVGIKQTSKAIRIGISSSIFR